MLLITSAICSAQTAEQQNFYGAQCLQQGLNDEAFSWFSAAAEKGNIDAFYNIGYCYEIGAGVQKDYVEAAKWYTKAADTGHIMALNGLGRMYLNGSGVAKDPYLAFNFFKKAADAGDQYGQSSIGYCYLYGIGTSKDYEKARKSLQTAVDKKVPEAMVLLGLIYETGLGVAKDTQKAFSLYLNAAQAGYQPAKKVVAICYANGIGVTKNLAEAVKWDPTIDKSERPVYAPAKSKNPQAAEQQRIKEAQLKQKRVALVVGNSSYKYAPLSNPVNDASDIAERLRNIGFKVTLITNAGKRRLEEAISDFAEDANGVDVAMFFYAGHGIQVKGTNYLIPVDADPRKEADVPFECTDVNRILANLEEARSKLNIIALDACRNNPFGRMWSRSTKQGLTMMDAPLGSLISFATSPGSTAADGEGRNSPYTAALLSELNIPNQQLETVFKNVANKVIGSTSQRQIPWYLSSIYQGQFIFNPK